MTKRVFLVAAEPSGDLLGREVAQHLRRLSPEITLSGIGGEEMAAIGLTSEIDTSPLSVLGLFEGVKAYPKVVDLADRATDEITAFQPDAVVLIDSWGFMLRVAQRLRKHQSSARLIKLIGPQVWATRAGRAKTLAASVDHLLAIFEMEVPYYEPHGLPTTVIGSPAVGRTELGDAAKFRAKHNLADDQKMVLVLPGSRPGEIKRVAPALMAAAEQIKKVKNDVAVVISPAASVGQLFNDEFAGVNQFATIVSDAGDRYGAMAAADLAIACSGTVTTELAMQGTPFLVGYKLGWMTWAIARSFLYKPDYMTILNIAAEKEVAPEFLQTKLKSSAITEKALALLSDQIALDAQVSEQNATLAKLGAGKISAAEKAAKAILEDLRG